MSDKSLSEKIQTRYSKEAESSCHLSCGKNIQHLAILPGEHILDLGCGKGAETMEAAILSGNNGLAVGLDLTREMLEKALKNASENCISNIRFVLGHLENLPFPGDSFDAILSNCAINHARDKKKVYREIYRVLKPGGRFVVSDAVTKVPLPASIKKDPSAWANCFGGAIPEEEYLHHIHSTGFSNINILSRREYVKDGYDFISLTIKAFKFRREQEVKIP